VAAWLLALPRPATASIIASDNFDAYTSTKALAGQGATGYGWSGGWTANAGATLNGVVTDSFGTTDMDYTPVGGTLIPGGTNSVDLTSGGSGTPVVARQLFLPQTGTFYAACAVRFETGNVNTGDMFGFCLNNDPASMAAGVNIGYYGNPTTGNLFFVRAGINTPTDGTTVSSRNGIHYLVVKVEKTGTGNYNKVTLWTDPAAGDDTKSPNGDFQLTTDLGISSIQQVGIFGQNLDSGDRCRVDSLALATTFADLMGPAGPGPGGGIPVNTIRVEAAADGSANAAVPAQNLPLLYNTLTVYAIARNASGIFLSNTPASWFLTNLTGSVASGDLVPAPDGKSAVFTSHMAGSAKILAVGNATNLVTSGVITIPAGIDQFDALRLYWWTNLMAGSPSPSTVASTANGYWNSMVTNAGRTYLWSDLPYASPNSYNIVATFIRLNAMAQAWAMPGCSLQGNSNLAAAVASGMDWMVANIYTKTATEYGNWFHWEDSGPQYFESAIVFLYPALTSTELNNYCAAIDNFNPNGWMTGANTADKIQIMAIRGILGKNVTKMVTARDEMSTLFPFVTGGADGFYPDGSFLFHSGFAYTGGYGVDLLSKIPTIANLLQPSQWQVTDPNLTNVFFWVTAGYEPLLYNGNMMDMVRGRNIAVDSETESSIGGDVLTAIRQVAAFAPPATGAAFTNFANSPRLTSGQFHFSNMDRVVAQRTNFAFGISMSSTRVACYESINNENLNGWFTGDGMTYLYVGSGETQFSGDFWPSVDPYFLPGTTVETTILTNGAGGDHQFTDQNWVGGASVAGSYGVAGMSLHPGCTNTTLSGRKSWFMLDNEIVCLGAGINCGDPAGVHTTAENRRLGSPITQSFTLNGKAITPVAGWSSNLPSATASWCALSGTGGYYFPAGQTNLQAAIVANSGAWSDIDKYTGPPTTVYTDNYLRLWYDHGTHPTNATYACVILPNFSASSVSNYALSPDIFILTNTAAIQAVKKPALGLVAGNFWNAGTNTADLITVNNKASVIALQSPRLLSVGIADPTQTNTGAITVTLNQAAANVQSTDPAITVVQLAPKIIFSANVNGQAGTALQAVFGLTGNGTNVALTGGALNDTNTWGLPVPVANDTNVWASGANTLSLASGVQTFYGRTLLLQTGGGFSPGVPTVTLTLNNLMLAGGTIYMANNSGLIMNLAGNLFTLLGGTLEGGAGTSMNVTFKNAVLTGNGVINITGANAGGGYVEFQSTVNPADFTGVFNVCSNGILHLPAIAATNASFGLNLSGNGLYQNSVNVALTSLSINGTNFPPGIYPSSSLAAYSACFTTNTGTITVVTTNRTPPALAAIASQTLLAGRTLSFTNLATDTNNVPVPTLTFSLPNAPAGAAVNATNGVFTWRPAIAQSPATNRLSVVVSDNWIPALTTTQNFTVTVTQPPKPVLKTPAVSHGQLSFTVTGTNGPDYTVLASTNLTSWSSVWMTSSPALPFNFTDPAATNLSRRFYRVQLGP